MNGMHPIYENVGKCSGLSVFRPEVSATAPSSQRLVWFQVLGTHWLHGAPLPLPPRCLFRWEVTPPSLLQVWDNSSLETPQGAWVGAMTM